MEFAEIYPKFIDSKVGDDQMYKRFGAERIILIMTIVKHIMQLTSHMYYIFYCMISNFTAFIVLIFSNTLCAYLH